MLRKFSFCKFANFFADSKSRAQELSNDVSFVIFRRQTWDLEGGQIDPPPSVSWFSSTSARIGLMEHYVGHNHLEYEERSAVCCKLGYKSKFKFKFEKKTFRKNLQLIK